MPNAEYAPKLEYLDILVKTIDISDLVAIRCGDRQMLSTCNRMNVCEEQGGEGSIGKSETKCPGKVVLAQATTCASC